MRRESIRAGGVAERGRCRGGELGLRVPGDLGEDESQRERPVPGPAVAREEPDGVVAAGAEQQRDQPEGEMRCHVTGSEDP